MTELLKMAPGLHFVREQNESGFRFQKWGVFLSGLSVHRIGTIKWHTPCRGYVFSKPSQVFIYKPETLAKIAGFCVAATEDAQ